MLTIIVGNVKCKIIGLRDPKIIDEIDEQLSYSVQGFQFMNKASNWDGRQRLFTKNHYFPIGLLPAIEKILKKNDASYQIQDNRDVLTYGESLTLDPNSGFEVRDYQAAIVKKAWKHGGGIIKSPTGCHSKGTKILMFDGSTKSVEDIVVGDILMGPDSKERKVLKLFRGQDRMVKIIPTKGAPFIINQEHVLSLKRTRTEKYDPRGGEIIDIKFSDWEKQNKTFKHIHKLFRVPINFPKKELPLEPYLLGLMLGDGTVKGQLGVTNTDPEIIAYVYDIAKKYNLSIRKSRITYYFRSQEKTIGKNPLVNIMRSLGLFGKGSGDKFIPLDFKTGDEEQRLEVLAGLLDTDGSLSKNGYDYISKSKQLAEDVIFLARSLGMSAYLKEKICTCTNNGKSGLYYRVHISGDCTRIPCKISRKRAPERNQIKDVLVTGFTFEEMGLGDYYGFQLDGDNRYLLGDFTVTHNSGKTLIISLITGKFNIRTVIYVIGIELLYQMKETVERAYPNLKVGLVGDGHCDVQQVTIATIWSAASAFGSKAEILDSDLTPDKEDKNLNKEMVRDMVMNAEMIIVDECQYAASETIQFLHKNSVKARHRFLLSGTPWRDSGDDILIESVGGPKFFDLNASSLIEQGWLVPPKIYFVDVPMQRGIGKTYQEVYKNFIVENEERNDLILKSTTKLVAQGRKVLILVTKVSHGKHLLSLLKDTLRVSSLDGSNKTGDRLAAIQAMKNGELDVLIASKIFDQGIDIPNLDALVLAGSGKSSARALQRIGRVIRKGKDKKDAVVVDFLDNCRYLRDHSLIRKKIYENEPAFKIIVQKR
jgi:superfamily II DNA or RNA helicase